MDIYSTELPKEVKPELQAHANKIEKQMNATEGGSGRSRKQRRPSEGSDEEDTRHSQAKTEENEELPSNRDRNPP